MVRVDLIDGKRVVVVFVPERATSPSTSRSRGSPRERIASDCTVTDADLNHFASLGNTLPFDQRLAPGATRSDIDLRAVEAYRQQLRTGRPGSELLLMGDDELLHAVGALQDGRVTNAGLALYGSQLALRRLWPSLRTDVITSDATELSDS